jgi:hypothetical protein
MKKFIEIENTSGEKILVNKDLIALVTKNKDNGELTVVVNATYPAGGPANITIKGNLKEFLDFINLP